MIKKGEFSPALIYIHGGGWTTGSIDSYEKVCQHLATAAKVKVISVEYRLTPEYPLPAGPDDVIEALKYIFVHGEKWGIDPANIAIGGDSAGGSMSALALRTK